MAKESHAELQAICDKIRREFDAKDAAREKGLTRSREVIRNSADAIRHVHRAEFAEAEKLMAASVKLLAEVDEALKDHPDVYYAGFVQDAQKEHAEAHATLALVQGRPLPDPDDLGVGYAPYLNALGEAIGELRRHALDGIRRNEVGWGEGILAAMDEVYYAMISFDYPPAIDRGLKRTADVTRSLIERTRGDITNAARQQRLESALAELEGRLKPGG
ncbi:MAG: haloacid dehalogenase [Armatimonadota bacterium]